MILFRGRSGLLDVLFAVQSPVLFCSVSDSGEVATAAVQSRVSVCVRFWRGRYGCCSESCFCSVCQILEKSLRLLFRLVFLFCVSDSGEVAAAAVQTRVSVLSVSDSGEVAAAAVHHP